MKNQTDMVKVRELILELGKLLEDPEVRLKSIKDLEVACQNKPEFISTIIEVLVNHLFDVKPVDSDAVETVFMAIFRQNKMATFAAVLKNHPTRLFPESDKDEYVYPSVQLRLYKIKSVKRRIADLIEKSLENVSKEELQQLAKLVEAEAALDANDCKFDVWDTVSVDRFLSCLQMAVPLFARGAPSMLVDCVLKLPDFDKLSDERKFDFLRALAEISSHTTAPVAQQLLPLVAELSKTYISQTERGDSKSFAYVECVLYLLLHLSHKAPDVATQTCSKEFMWRFKSLKSRTWERMKILAKTLSQDDIDVLDAEKKVGRHIIVMETKFRAEAKRQSTKTEIRSCINILAIRKLLKKRKFCFVKLSWKEARNASKPSKTYRNKIYQRAPYRSAELESISKDCSSELAQYGKCDLSYKQVQRLVGSKKFQEFSSDRKGPFVLNDTCGTAMLSWHMEESALSFLKECGEEGRSGKVRNQMYHLTCAMYVGSDLVSSERHLRKLEKKEQGEKKKQGEMRKQGENTKGEKKKQCQPLCPWNLCIFCDPSKLGKDKRAKEDKRNRLHHCYGAEIENVLSHIQANGASREIVSDFLCTDYLPPTADDPSMKRRKNIKLRRLHSLKEVVKELKKHTVGADLINYSGLMRGDKEVYEACMDPESVFVSYHAVVIEKIQKMGDDWVAVCKMSNGRYLGRDGYCNVSLTTKYIPIGVSDVQGDLIRGSEKPMHLLTNFIIVEIIEDEEENWNSDDEEDAKDDKKPSEENPKEKQKEPEKKRKEPEEKRKDREEKKYTPKKFRSSGNTPSDQLTQVTESDAVDVIEDAITRHNSNSTTELTALVARFPSISEYVALNMLMKAITFDDQAVQRHSVTVLECVKDPDASVRKRALELVTLLVNENNVTQLTKELIDYLEISDEDFKEDLSAKICFIVEKFSPEKLWYIDQMLKVLCEAGKFVKDDVWHALIVVISNASELHGYTVRALYRAVLTYSEQETLVRVAVWCIGEYGDLLVNNVGMIGSEDPITVTESDAVDVIEDAITRHNSDSTTKAMALVALLKLSSRFPSISERIKDIIVKQKGSLLLEMQQRAIEYNSIVDRHKNIRSSLVERMPVLDEATFNVRRAGSFPASASTGAKASVSLPNGFEKPAVAPLVDLLDLDSDDILAAPSSSGADYLQDLLGVDLGSSSSQFGATQAPKAGTDLLLDILSIGTPSPAQNSISSIDLLSIADANSNPSNALDTLSSPVPPHTATTASTRMFDLLDGLSPSPSKEATNGPAYPSIVAYESSSLKIEFTFSKPPGNPQTTNVQATFINLSPNTFTDFIFQAAVPKFLQLHLDPASSNTLPASGNGAITQNLKVTNSQHGKKSLVMRMRIGYKLNEKDVLEEGQVSNFPRGL